MPRRSDYSDQPSTLPPPELNPTLNPLLGQNMGRWAEVYFTSPPEKREEAILELLRRLEAENPAPEESGVAQPPVAAHPPGPQELFESHVEADDLNLVECQSCGRKNPAQRFCGMCGARMESATESDTRMTPAACLENLESQFLQPRETVELPLAPVDLSSDRAYRETDSSDHIRSLLFDVAPARHSYRLYIGGALVMVILAISYIAWRGTPAKSGSPQLAPQAPIIAVQPADATRTPGTTGELSDPNSNAARPAGQETGTKHAAEEPTATATIAHDADSKSPTPPAVSGGGFEELTTARHYLDGIDGQKPDTAAAVDWLWKAVAKRNIDATLILSDLFLKGRGVPQNCDQGRVLLDAAASRGSKEAAERLRHLQAFGCQ